MFANAASIEPVDGLNVNQPFYQPEAFVIQKQAPVVDLTGIPVELHGQRIMSQAGKEVELFLANARRKFEVIGLDPIEMSIELTEVFKNSKKLNPEFIGTLESLAQELGIDARELFALSQTDYAVVKLMEKGKKTEVKPGGCTSMAFNSSGVVGQTNDLASLDYGSGIILKKDQSITTMTGFGPAGQSLGKRVGVVINFLGADTQGMDVSDSMATGMGALVDALAKTRSVEEAVELLTTNRTIVGMNFTIADIDGNAASVEVGRDGLLVTIGEKGVAHANHSLREGSEESFRANLGGNFKEQTIASSYSFWRQEAAETFLKHTPEIDVDAMKYIFNQKPIAQSAAYGSDFITVNTVVLDTQSGCMNYAPGIGDWTGYQQVCFNSQH
ncbi:hypothetical protein GCM10007895_14150 [Paraferrimonas sedimenticola]|uniref:Peptidase C45 hydrolase domain-containing protein n=2 Tax=Paraferrimonas sedimenticola TaxID=375674 RepID=A0AA37RVL9_9GAMM|nr:hypothetical protein GCM10007895_14150 [Paraferrimonas sedimenticola]